MSPSEADLRAALRDGEDDGRPDVDGLLTHVRGRRAQRRTRVLSTAAVVVVVAAAAVGGAAVWGGSGGSSGGPQAGSSPAATGAAGGATASGQAQSAPPSGGSDTTSASPGCPADYPARSVPGGGVPSGSVTGRMFAAPVRSVLICAYTETKAATGTTAAPLVLTGDNANALVDSIETASTSKLRIMCPDIVSAQRKQLAIIGVTAGGTRLPVVTTDVSIPNCNQPVTNGTAVRYAWRPPASLASLISALTTRTGAVPRVPGVGSGQNGSPVR